MVSSLLSLAGRYRFIVSIKTSSEIHLLTFDFALDKAVDDGSIKVTFLILLSLLTLRRADIILTVAIP